MNHEEIQEYFERIGLTDREKRWICDLVQKWAERIVYAIQEFVEEVACLVEKTVEPLADVVREIYEELEKAGFFADMKPCAWKKAEVRERARIIEQKYRAEIRRCERERHYRRIYKPP